MIADLKPYPAMKDCGVPWLEEVPEAWSVHRGRHVFEIKKRIAGKLGHPVLSVTQAGLRVKDVNSGEGQVSQDYSKYQIVEPGEFVMNSMDLLTGGVGIADAAGVTSPDYRVFAIRDAGLCRDRYVLYVLRMLYANRGFYAQGQGSAQFGRWRLPRKRFNEFLFPVPPLLDQTAIVRFLDHADRRIRRYIRTKQKLIKLLEEQRQAIIHRAVTRGLDPNVRLKPSGVRYLGDVPEHWEVVRFKRCVGFQEGPGIMAADFRESGVPLLRVSSMQGETATLDGCNFLDPEMVERRWSHFTINPGNYLLSASASMGNVVLATEVVAGAIPYTGILRLWPLKATVCMPFVRLYMGCRPFQDQIDAAKSGVGIEHFGPTHLRRMSIALPSLLEQRDIVQTVEVHVAPLKNAAERALHEIALLREYRTRIVSDVVTGKLDVRGAAANLPGVDDSCEEVDCDDSQAGDMDLDDLPELLAEDAVE